MRKSPTQSHLQATVSPFGLTTCGRYFSLQTAFRVEACERALMWLALRLPDIGSVGRTWPQNSRDFLRQLH